MAVEYFRLEGEKRAGEKKNHESENFLKRYMQKDRLIILQTFGSVLASLRWYEMGF